MKIQDWVQQQEERSRVITDTLPSGLEIKRRVHVDLEALVFTGQLPMEALVSLMDEEGGIELTEAEVLEDINTYRPLLEGVFIATVVEPKVTQDKTDLEQDPPQVALPLFSSSDMLYILSEVMGPTKDLGTFREDEEE